MGVEKIRSLRFGRWNSNYFARSFVVRLALFFIIAFLSTTPSVYAYQALDLTPTTGTLTEGDDPVWANKGYEFTASRNIHMESAEWWLTLPAGAQVRARVYNTSGTVLAEGTFETGDGTEQWYRSDIDFVFASGQTYVLSFFCDQSGSALFDRKDTPTQPFNVTGFATGISNKAGSSQIVEEFPSNNNSWAPFIRIVESKSTEDMTPATGSFVEGDSMGNTAFWNNKSYEFTASRNINMKAAEWWLALPAGASVRARVYDNSTGALLAEGAYAYGDGTEKWYRSILNFTFIQDQTYVLAFYCDQGFTTPMDRMDNPTLPYDIQGFVTGVRNRSSSNVEGFPGLGTNSWAPFFRIVEQGRGDLTPSTGSLIEGDDPGWANKGYEFTASRNIQMKAAEWWLTLPVGAHVRARVYDTSGMVLAEGTFETGDGTEQWYRSEMEYTFRAGQTYVLSFYCDQSTVALFDRMNSPVQPFDIPGFASAITHKANSSQVVEEFPITTNSWAPFIVIVEKGKFPWPMFVPATTKNR